MDHHHAHGAAKGVHNMAVVGRHRIFLSHLPMFMAPHDSQVILEAHFLKQGKNLDDIYAADRAAHPEVRPELMLAHFVTKAPDFDQILSVSATGSLPTADELQSSPMVDIAKRGNLVKDRLKTKETSPGRCHSVGAHQMRELNLTVRAELYFEEGELSSSDFTSEMMSQTKEEKAAGFD